jgi:SAM-dependent methyltransferase
MSRFDLVTKNINLLGCGLEIGPSHSPVLKKSMGYDVRILDHLNRDELIEKYRKLGVKEDALLNIDYVDYVWDGRPISDVIGDQNCFDYIIASHVIEHTPDLVSFLKECELLLKVGGVLSLVVPDKRCCFDRLRPLTSTGDVVDAFVQKRIRPSIAAVFDHFSLASFKRGAHTWPANLTDKPVIVSTFSDVQDMMDVACNSTEYIDIHNWVFVLDSFRVIIKHLNMLGYINLSEIFISDTEDFEFFIHLQKSLLIQKSEFEKIDIVAILDKVNNY